MFARFDRARAGVPPACRYCQCCRCCGCRAGRSSCTASPQRWSNRRPARPARRHHAAAAEESHVSAHDALRLHRPRSGLRWHCGLHLPAARRGRNARDQGGQGEDSRGARRAEKGPRSRSLPKHTVALRWRTTTDSCPSRWLLLLLSAAVAAAVLGLIVRGSARTPTHQLRERSMYDIDVGAETPLRLRRAATGSAAGGQGAPALRVRSRMHKYSILELFLVLRKAHCYYALQLPTRGAAAVHRGGAHT
jgi:hypothetical protein